MHVVISDVSTEYGVLRTGSVFRRPPYYGGAFIPLAPLGGNRRLGHYLVSAEYY